MNKFDKFFFNRYVTEGSNIIEIAHKHITVILGKIVLNYFFGVILPTFFYYNSDLLKSYIPFFVLEIFILIVFLRNIYNVFDWYNDVWIITSEGVTDLSWELFSTNSVSVKFNSIEGLELIQDGFIDTMLSKGDIVINKIGGDNNFVLKNAANAFKVLERIDEIQKKFGKNNGKNNEMNGEGVNFEVVVKALSGVVEEYLGKTGYKKDDSEETKRIIEKMKKAQGTIDLTKKQ